MVTATNGAESPALPARAGAPAHHTPTDLPGSRRPARTVLWLSSLIAVLALVAAAAGLLWPGGDGSHSFTTHRGQTVELYGEGLYRDDTLFIGALNRGTDAVTLLVGIPLLVFAAALYRRGSVRGGLVLLGALTWFLYVGASYALGAVAYNDLFLVYVALFSTSVFALALAFRSFDARVMAERFSARMPRRRLAGFLIASGVLTLGVWLMTPVTALITGDPPERLDIYATLFTNALDMALIVPVLILTGRLILQRNPLGYLIAAPLLVLEVLLAPMIAAQTVSQLWAGVSLSPGEVIGPVAGFAGFGLLATWMLVRLLGNIADAEPA